MSPEDLVQALFEASDAAARQALLVPRDEEFYVRVAHLLKDEADQERLRDPRAALGITAVAVEVAEVTGIPRCRALAAWAKGNVLIHQGEYEECLGHYRQAAHFFATAGAEVESACLTSNQAWVLKNLGRYGEGIQAAQEALGVFRQRGEQRFLASTLNALGTLYKLQGYFDEALPAYAESEQIYAALGAPVQQARLNVNRANTLQSLDRFEEAVSLLQEARAVLTDHTCFLEVARANLNLGIIYSRLGRYDQAIEALDLAEQGFAAQDISLEVAVVELHRANLYTDLNLYEELLRISTRDSQVFAERQMQWHAARATMHQAVAWWRMGNPVQAEELLPAAQAAFAQIGDSIWAHIVGLERAALWAEMGDWPLAMSIARDAAAFFHDKQMPVRAAGALLLVAQCHLALEQVDEAANLYQEAWDRARALDIPNLLYRAQHGLGLVAERQGRLRDARDHFHRAVEIVESQRQGLQVEDFRLGFLEDKLQLYRDAVLLCLRMGCEEEAFAYADRTKSAALVDLLVAGMGRDLSEQDPDAAALATRLKALRERLNWHYSKLRGAESEDRGWAGYVPEAETWQQISAIEQETARTWRKLQQISPFYARQGIPVTYTPTAVRSWLKPGQVLVEYYSTPDALHAFVVGEDGLRAHLPLPLSPDQIQDAVGALDSTVRNASRFDPEYVAHTLTPLGRQQLGWLYDDLVRPLEPFLRDATRLLIVPDDLLFEAPFHALHDGEGYLVERYEVVYVPGAGILHRCQENYRHRSKQCAQVLVMGYARDEDLPHVRREVESVSSAVTGALVFRGPDATIANLQKHAPQSACLHLAAHAVFRGDNPLFSALQLAGDEWLRVIDLYTLRLNGSLVTLSGCETGRHRLFGGDLMGLSRGFFAAGAAALVVSLWPVDDAAAAILMEQFYSHLVAGETAATALRRAQLRLREFQVVEDGRMNAPYAHPFYWAPFCLLGAPDVRLTL